MTNPRVTDNDAGEITITLDGKELRGWSYANDGERRQKMLQAREYVEGWCDARESSGAAQAAPDGWPDWFPASPADIERGDELFIGGYTWTLHGEDGPKEYKFREGRWYRLNGPVTASPARIAERLADVVIMLDAPDAYNREYIAAVCRSILSPGPPTNDGSAA